MGSRGRKGSDILIRPLIRSELSIDRERTIVVAAEQCWSRWKTGQEFMGARLRDSISLVRSQTPENFISLI